MDINNLSNLKRIHTDSQCGGYHVVVQHVVRLVELVFGVHDVVAAESHGSLHYPVVHRCENFKQVHR